MSRVLKFRVYNGMDMIYDVGVSGTRDAIGHEIDPYALYETYDEKSDGSLRGDGWHAVSGEHIMQFTGLHDKNGKEIYEGDIIKADWEDHRYDVIITDVTWDNGLASFVFPGGTPYVDAPNYFEVIGNIHENPNLLTK